MSNNLSEKSQTYYSEKDIYLQFSKAEDSLQVVEKYLLPQVKNKHVLDLGCGNGKYLELLKDSCSSLYGLDLSAEQLKLIPTHHNIVCADAALNPFLDNSFDVVYSCWMFGTILDENKRLTALNEAKRIVKHGGKIILIENSEFSEFEKIRGRFPDPLHRTRKYNEWLYSQQFSLITELNTCFQFIDDDEANDVFNKIWKDRFLGPVSSKIRHDISVLEWTK